MRRYEIHIAMRYLFSRERRALASVITVIATLGVAIGVAALIVVLGVMDGARDLLFGRMAQLFPHVQIQAIEGVEIKTPDAQFLAKLKADARVDLAVPVLNKYGIIQGARGLESDKEPVTIFSLDADTAKLYRTKVASLGRDKIMIGEPLARALKVKPGDQIRLMTVNPSETAGRQNVKVARLTVETTYTMGFNEFDMRAVFMNGDRLREIYGAGASFDYIHVKLKAPLESAEFNNELRLPGYGGLRLPAGYTSWDWSDPQHSEAGGFFTMLTFQKYMLFMLLLLIIVVAAFNIIGTLILMVNDKTREIGILRAIGADRSAVARIFLFDGVLVGLTGTIAGVFLGVIICFVIPLIDFPMPASIYNFERLPVQIHLGSVLLVIGATLLICTLASLLPARHAAKLHPVEALRYD